MQRAQDIASIQSIARHTTLIQLFTNRNTIVISLNICMFHIWPWVDVYRKLERPAFSFMVQHQRNGLSEKKAQSHQNQQVHDRLVNILTAFVPSLAFH